MKTMYRKSWAANLFMWSDLTLSPSCLLLVLEVCNCPDNTLLILDIWLSVVNGDCYHMLDLILGDIGVIQVLL